MDAKMRKRKNEPFVPVPRGAKRERNAAAAEAKEATPRRLKDAFKSPLTASVPRSLGHLLKNKQHKHQPTDPPSYL